MSRTLFVGDVHGCSAELRALLDQARAERVILLGDLFTKGPDPAGVWQLVVEHGCESVLGNHDQAVLGRRKKASLAGALPRAARTWLAERPLMLEGDGPAGPWLAVHAGIDPVRGPAGTSADKATVVRRFPDDADPSNPFWWELWTGPPLVLYGHDAVRGLVDRRPHSLGLDTGCVYGRQLSGYLLEEDRLLSVPAARVYRDHRR